MKAVIQRVLGAKLSADGVPHAEISIGLVVFVGVEQSDTEANAVAFAQKLCAMRIFSDADGKMNLSVSDINGDILLVSNFTLCADISHGHRPSFTGAMRPPSAASALFDHLVGVVKERMRGTDGKVASGVFGADMRIEQINDGPVTIIY